MYVPAISIVSRCAHHWLCNSKRFIVWYCPWQSTHVSIDLEFVALLPGLPPSLSSLAVQKSGESLVAFLVWAWCNCQTWGGKKN